MLFSYILDTYFGFIWLLLGSNGPKESWKRPKEKFRFNTLRYSVRQCTIVHCRRRKKAAVSPVAHLLCCTTAQPNALPFLHTLSNLGAACNFSWTIAQHLRYNPTSSEAINGLGLNIENRDPHTIKGYTSYQKTDL